MERQPITQETTCKYKSRFYFRTCPNPVVYHAFGLCIFHLLSVSEKLPDHSLWKLSSLLASEWPARIHEQFFKLVKDSESDQNKDKHDYEGFWLPSTDLRGVIFTKPVDFSNAVFLQNAIFSESTFHEHAYFWRSSFIGGAEFMSMSFEQDACFNAARFRKETLFSDAVFRKDADFCDALIEGDLVFENDDLEGRVDFSSVKIRNDGHLIFSDVDLKHSCFDGTNLDQVDFRGVRWYRTKGRMSRCALWGEFANADDDANENQRSHSRIADSYHQLVLNCERKRDFESAEDFHIGEMEMRRRTEESRFRAPLLKWFWKHLNAYALYWRFSRYGTSYMAAFSWLLVWVVAVFPLVFMISGFNTVDAITGKLVETIDYQMRPDFRHFGQWLTDWLSSVDFSISIATFQRSRYFEPSGGLTYFFSAIESVVIAAQSALVLFAIRRRFKR